MTIFFYTDLYLIMNRICIIFLILNIVTVNFMVAQNDTLDILSQDTLAPVQRSGNFNFVLSRSYILNADFQEGVPLVQSETGTSSVGFSLNKNFSKYFALHFQPVFKTLRLSFKNDKNRTFPNDPDTSLFLQKYRIYYLATDLGLRFNIKKDEKNRPKTFLELGFSLGYNIGNSEKKLKFTQEKKIKIKSPTIENLQKIYTGSYLKVNYRWLGLHFNYRFSNIFKKDATYRYDLYDYRKYPSFPRLEVGICLVL